MQSLSHEDFLSFNGIVSSANALEKDKNKRVELYKKIRKDLTKEVKKTHPIIFLSTQIKI